MLDIISLFLKRSLNPMRTISCTHGRHVTVHPYVYPVRIVVLVHSCQDCWFHVGSAPPLETTMTNNSEDRFSCLVLECLLDGLWLLEWNIVCLDGNFRNSSYIYLYTG